VGITSPHFLYRLCAFSFGTIRLDVLGGESRSGGGISTSMPGSTSSIDGPSSVSNGSGSHGPGVGAVGGEFSLRYRGRKSKSSSFDCKQRRFTAWPNGWTSVVVFLLSTRFIGLVNAKPRPDRTRCCPRVGCFGGAMINGRLERKWLCNNVKFATVVYHQVQSSTVCIEGVWTVGGRCNRPEGIRARI
jgi:hypothetical protein